jgi:hypothetical protein
MKRKNYLIVSGTVFSIVAFLHLIRAVLDVSMEIGSWPVPTWMSWAAFIGGSLLSAWAFKELHDTA